MESVLVVQNCWISGRRSRWVFTSLYKTKCCYVLFSFPGEGNHCFCTRVGMVFWRHNGSIINLTTRLASGSCTGMRFKIDWLIFKKWISKEKTSIRETILKKKKISEPKPKYNTNKGGRNINWNEFWMSEEVVPIIFWELLQTISYYM